MSSINEWLRTNTFHHSEFANVKETVEEKERQGLRISLCIPTLNEEKTIGKEVVIFRSELMQRNPLLDEIAVIDSGVDRPHDGGRALLRRRRLSLLGDPAAPGREAGQGRESLEGDLPAHRGHHRLHRCGHQEHSSPVRLRPGRPADLPEGDQVREGLL